MNLLFRRFELVHFLNQSRNSYSALVNDLVSGQTGIVLRVIRGNFAAQPGTAFPLLSWLQAHNHPNLDQLVTAGIGDRNEVYWVRTYYENAVSRVATHPN